MENRPLAAFHILSDTHISVNSESGARYKAALQDITAMDPDGKCGFVVSGDLTGSGKPEEMEEFYRLTRENISTDPEKIMLLLGNHDVRGADGSLWNKRPDRPCIGWEERRKHYLSLNAPYMSEEDRCGLCHRRVLNGYTFLMLNTELGLKDAPYLGSDQLRWIEENMRRCWEEDPEKPVFLVSHQALNNTHWMSNILDGFDGLSNEKGTGPSGRPQEYSWGADKVLKEILKKYPCGVFLSGHIHNQFGVSELQLREWGAALDLPAFGQESIGYPKLGTGYKAEIYSDKVLFRARNFAAGCWLPEYDKVLPLPSLPVVLHEKQAPVPEAMQRIYDQEGIGDPVTLPPYHLFDNDVLHDLESFRRNLLENR